MKNLLKAEIFPKFKAFKGWIQKSKEAVNNFNNKTIKATSSLVFILYDLSFINFDCNIISTKPNVYPNFIC